MKRSQLFIWLLTPFLICCSQASLKTVEFNPATGLYEKIHYSSRFEAQDYLIPKKVKILVYGKIRGRVGKEALLGSDEKLQSADFKIYFSNNGKTNSNFVVNSILYKNKYFSNQLLDKPRDLVIVPDTVERIEVDGSKVDRFDKKCKILIDYTYGQQKFIKEIELSRLTTEEANLQKSQW